jgi:branched-subunit amino acid transport protein
MIEDRVFWYVVALLAIGTLAIRSSIILVAARVQISERHKEIFSFIPAAVFPALAASMVYFHDGQVYWLFGKERLFVLILATGVAYRIRKITVTLLFGLLLLYFLTHS